MRQRDLNIGLSLCITVHGTPRWLLHICLCCRCSQLFQTASWGHLRDQLLSIYLAFHLAWLVGCGLLLLKDQHGCGLGWDQNWNSSHTSLDWVQAKRGTERHLAGPPCRHLILTLCTWLAWLDCLVAFLILLLLLFVIDSSSVVCAGPRICSISH